MRLIDLLIIYLALGAPFAVSLFLRDRALTIGKRTLTFLSGLLAWPVMVIAILYRLTSPKKIGSERSADLLRLRYELEQVCLNYCSTANAFTLRDALEKYIGISTAAAQESSDTVAEIFSQSEHPQPAMATRCLTRVNRRKLKFHQESARSELITAVFQPGIVGETKTRMFSLLSRLASAVEDRGFPTDLHQLPSVTGRNIQSEFRTAA